MKILVTGAMGFIGRHVVPELVSAGHQVISTDRADDGMDLTVPGVAQSLVSGIKPDIVLHLAARVGRLNCETRPWTTISDNVAATVLVAEACRDYGVRLAYMSSSEIYGDNGRAACDEYLGPFSPPPNLYGLTKLQGEQACQLYVPENHLIMRLCMPYGDDSPAGYGKAALPTFIANALAGEEIIVHRGAERSWCWIGDAVRAIRMAIEELDIPYTINIGHAREPMAMFQIAEMVCRAADAPSGLIKIVDAPPAQTLVKRLAFDRLHGLGWEPETPIAEGIRRCVEAMRP
jgi:nucleoside-diphosphate-sugar epimerase